MLFPDLDSKILYPMGTIHWVVAEELKSKPNFIVDVTRTYKK